MKSFPARIGGLVAVAILLAPFEVVAQTTTDEPSTADLQQQLAQLRESIAKTSGVVSEHTDQIEKLTNLIDSVVSKFDGQERLLADQSAQIETLKTDMEAVTTNLRKQIGDQEAILSQISKPGSDGRHVLALRSIMQDSPEFTDEVRQVVNDSIAKIGTLEVHNLMEVGKYFKVNGVESYIPARSNKSFTVPVGTLTTELVGDEPLRSCTVGPPNYTQRVEISPKRVERTVERPISEFSTIERVYVDPPYYVSPPIVVWP